MAGYFLSFTEVAAHLDGLGLFRMQPGLERITDVLARLGLKRPPFKVIQVAGTNGKGSTSAMLASLAQAHGLKTGLGTSPHFVNVRERARINGRMLGEGAWLNAANRVMAHGGEQLSYFEFVVALTVAAFAAEGVELAVMETGLGGTWDATTALEADLVVFTPIALDHQGVLGPDLAAIARDKAGALRPRGRAISAPQRPEVAAELQAGAARTGSSLVLAPTGPPPGLADLAMPLSGMYQRGNATLAIAAWRLAWEEVFGKGALPAGAPLTPQEGEGLERAWLPGRMQRVPATAVRPPLLLDGAHNTHGMAALGHSLALQGIAPAAVIFACLEDKSPAELVAHLRPLAHGPVFIPPIPDNPRALAPETLAKLVGLSGQPAASLEEALAMAAAFTKERFPEIYTDPATRHPVLICGSLYLLGEFYALEPQWLEPPIRRV